MNLTRRQVLQTVSVAAVLGGAGLSGCTSSSGGSSSAGTGTAALKLSSDAWRYDADNDVYYQLGVSYLSAPQAPEIETLGVYVPGGYVTGTKNSSGTYTAELNSGGKVGDYTATTAPVVLPVNTPGYAGQAPPSSYNFDDVADFMAAGLIYVAVGLRGKDTNTDSYSGNAPWGVTGLKAAVRFVRYNAKQIPGDTNNVFLFGHSGGGAQSSIVGASGSSALYRPYLLKVGAAMKDDKGNDLSDAVAGVMAWCPITNLDYADAAYEWNMGQFSNSGTRAEGTWTRAYSQDLALAYANHINELKLTDDSGAALELGPSEDGVYLSGSYYDHVLGVITTSLNNFLADTTFPYTPASQTQGGGNEGGAAPSGGKPSGDASAGGSSGSGTTYETVQDYIDYLNSDTKWVSYDKSANKAKVKSLAGFVASQKPPTKDVGAFDAIDRSATENVVFGSGTEGWHFSPIALTEITDNQAKYEALSGWNDAYGAAEYDHDVVLKDDVGETVDYRVDMYNPMFYLSKTYQGYASSTISGKWRIRTGIMQGDTASTVEINLALALANAGVSKLDFATVWGQGHTMAERSGGGTSNFIAWVKDVYAD